MTGRSALLTSPGIPPMCLVAWPAATTTALRGQRARLGACPVYRYLGDRALDRRDPGGRRGRAQGGQVPAVVHGQVAGGEYAAAGGRCEERLAPAAFPGVKAFGLEPDREPEVGEPVECGQVAVVVGDGERALGAQSGGGVSGLFQFGVERREAADGVQVEVEQVPLAEHRFRYRAEHACRDQARPVGRPRVVGARATATGIDEDDVLPRPGGAPGDGRADHPAAHDNDVRVHARSLRRHYPDQVRRSEASRLPLSPVTGSRALFT